MGDTKTFRTFGLEGHGSIDEIIGLTELSSQRDGSCESNGVSYAFTFIRDLLHDGLMSHL